MSPLLATCLCFGAYLLAYRFYARYLARRLFELDPARRKAIYCELQTLLSNDGGALIPVFVNYVDAKLSIVKGWEPHPAFTLLAGEFFETAWLDT